MALLFPYSQEIKIGIGIGVIGFFFLSMHQLLLGVFQKHLAMHWAALAEVVGRGVQLALVYLVFIKGIGGDSAHTNNFFLFIAIMSVASFVIFCSTFLFARRYIKIGLRFDFAYWGKIIKTTWPIALSIVLTLVYFKIDTIFLSLMKPAADVGIYGVAYRVLEGLIFFPAIFSGIMMPILSRNAVNDRARFNEVLKKSLRAITIFAAPVVVGGVILSYSITTLIGGDAFTVAGAPMQALFVAIGLIFFGNILGRAIVALDIQKKAISAYLFGVVLNIVLNLIFIPKYSYMGAAWSTVLTEFFIVIFLFWIVFAKTKISLDFATFAKTAFAAVVMGGVLVFTLTLRSLDEVGASPITTPLSIWGLVGAMFLGAVVYFGVLYLVRGISSKEIATLFRNK